MLVKHSVQIQTLKMPKKFAHAAISKSTSSDNPNRVSTKGGQRSKSTIARLKMYKSGKVHRDADGKKVGGKLMMSDKAGGQDIGKAARIAPDRRWFGNTRTMSQTELDKFRDEMTTSAADPYSVVLRRKKIPMALLKDAEKVARMNLLETESFDSTFNKSGGRKRPKISEHMTDYADFAKNASDRGVTYDANPNKDSNIVEGERVIEDVSSNDLFAKGQSKRIWAELYKVLDSSDVILQIVDARNVPGTRCEHIERHIKKNASHKHLVIVLNKCDLVPAWVTRKWVKILSASFPTLAFHASITNSFGKGALISLLRQFSKLHVDKRQISVGVIGYPNTGKSSVINALMGKKVCRAAPVPGQTKVWQYIALMKRIFLIDCPGVVYDVGDDDVDTVLKGVVRSERLEEPTEFIAAILSRVKKEYIQKHYLLENWSGHIDFLEKLARRNGKLLKGGEPDVNNVAVQMINDWQRGKLPYFVAPPRMETDDTQETMAIKDGQSDDENDDTPLQLEQDKDEDNEKEDSSEEEDDGEEEEEVPVKVPLRGKRSRGKTSWGDI